MCAAYRPAAVSGILVFSVRLVRQLQILRRSLSPAESRQLISKVSVLDTSGVDGYEDSASEDGD